jgi:hypothetical protein
METAREAEKESARAINEQNSPRCPVCAEPMTDLYPKPRCRKCGYLQSCCNPDYSDCEGR